jgi:hypothetical protein
MSADSLRPHAVAFPGLVVGPGLARRSTLRGAVERALGRRRRWLLHLPRRRVEQHGDPHINHQGPLKSGSSGRHGVCIYRGSLFPG